MTTPKQLHDVSQEADRGARELARLKQEFLELYQHAMSSGAKLPQRMHHVARRCKP